MAKEQDRRDPKLSHFFLERIGSRISTTRAPTLFRGPLLCRSVPSMREVVVQIEPNAQ